MNDDPQVVDALRSSVVLRAMSAVRQRLWAAAASSTTAYWVDAGRRLWLARSAADRHRTIGVALAAAAVTHVVLLLTHETPPGRLWLAPPALAMVVGSLFVLSAAEPSDR